MAIKSKIIIVSAAIAAMSAGYWLSSMKMFAESDRESTLEAARHNYSPIQGSILSPARKISIPPLLKDDGTTFIAADLKGQWHLLFFGYTNCPDICPVTMGTVAQAKKLAAENDQAFPQVVFISVDPERDSVEMLADYVQYFDKDFIGVTGDSKLIKALTLQMSVVYMKMSSEDDSGSYLVDHSSALLLLNPEGKLVAFLNPPHEPKIILKDFQTIVDLSK